MPERQAPRLDREWGELLPLAVYQREFTERKKAAHGHPSWKLERRQHFEEQDDLSFDALVRGDWEKSLRLLADERDFWLSYVAADEERGTPFHRVRVVEEPPTPYLQWELHALRVQAECGVSVRVVDAERLRSLERSAPLPEVVVLGGSVLYEVRYTDAGAPEGAVRHTDPEVVATWEEFISGLYAAGEDLIAYVDRYVARLPPPALQRIGE